MVKHCKSAGLKSLELGELAQLACRRIFKFLAAAIEGTAEHIGSPFALLLQTTDLERVL